jgi:8-oxo-dGTP pyrophosphatase MutT (NUDIX family)
MSQPPPHNSNENLSSSLHKVLTDLAQNPYPTVPNPSSCKKRASVALILRIRPSHWPPDLIPPDSKLPVAAQLKNLFAQSWVRNGDPEVVFIKRAARVGDRWTSHVALPGGKRDPEDEDDQATAVRETSEEIGLDLMRDALFVGNLPERVISTSWGKVPYVFTPDGRIGS